MKEVKVLFILAAFVPVIFFLCVIDWYLLTKVLTPLMLQKTAVSTPQQEAKRAIKSTLRNTTIHSIHTSAIHGLYEIVAGKNIFYSGPKGRYLVFGHIYDVKTQQDLTANRQQALQPKPVIRWQTLPAQAAIIANPDKKQKLAVFLDPDCPYCRELVNQLRQIKTIQIHYYLYPLVGVHPNAAYHSSQIWCSQNRLMRLYQITSGQTLEMKGNCNLSALKAIKKYGRDHQFNVTPILIRSDGQVHFGYLNKAALLIWLHQINQAGQS